MNVGIFDVAAKGTGLAGCIYMTTEQRLDKIEHDIELLRKELRDLLQRFLKYVEDMEDNPVRD